MRRGFRALHWPRSWCHVISFFAHRPWVSLQMSQHPSTWTHHRK
ncbi:hypothetical protein THTE_1871 [Thermogutta terrifontis]|uniref:Uncharacterized protein n=1 Tax=Thermogutta terrifontis TaxID=1331910 RepID=A0A286REU6_9BACT|nr:hypothetical protein THTE_1871 [Thermogutta terrifontis]